VEWDDALEQNPRVRAELARGHLRAERWLRLNAGRVVLRLETMMGIHREMFRGAFPDVAGRLRGPAPEYVPRNVSFGVYRGVPSGEVPAECRVLCERLEGYIRHLDGLQSDPESEWFTDQVLTVAAYAHCELIRIHPFVNGNGRLARTVINYFAWRYGFLPITYERPKGEYLAAVRVWLRYRKIEPFKQMLRGTWEPRLEPT
jgi:Fic family protein